jgi:hypothetical protein
MQEDIEAGLLPPSVRRVFEEQEERKKMGVANDKRIMIT